MSKKIFFIISIIFINILSAKQVVDVTGRTVTVKDDAKTMILGEGRILYALSLLQENPVENILAWRNDFIKNDYDAYQKYLAKFPEMANIVDLGELSVVDVSLEKIIELKPDVFVYNLDNYQKAIDNDMLGKLEKVGIATVFVDFRQYPTTNTIPSIKLLGEIFNKQQKAADFINYYNQQIELVTNITSKIKEQDRPLVFIENAAGLTNSCCLTYGKQNFGEYIDLAGGRNWGSIQNKGYSIYNINIRINPEEIFSRDFDYIIGTGSSWKNAYNGAKSVSLGYFATPEQLQHELKGLSERRGWRRLKAVQNKNFYSIHHQFQGSPYHFIALQVFAKWFHPELFKDLDPMENYKEFYKKFLPIDYSGYFWFQLK